MQDNTEFTEAVVMVSEHKENGNKTSLVLDTVRDRLAEQLRQIAALDARAGFILGSASLLTGVLALYKTPHLNSSNVLTLLLGNNAQDIVNGVPFAGILTYLTVVLTSYLSYLLVRWTNAPDPSKVVQNADKMSMSELQNKLIKEILGAIKKNEGKLAMKVWWTRLAFASLFLEIAIVAILLAISNLS